MRDGKVVDSRADRRLRPGDACPGDGGTRCRAAPRARRVRRRRRIKSTAPGQRRRPDDQPVLRIADASVTGRDGRVLLDGLDLEVHAGEIVGVAGVEGNGQRTLGDVLSSLCPLDPRLRRGRRSAGDHRSSRRHGEGRHRHHSRRPPRQRMRARLQRRREHVHRRSRAGRSTRADEPGADARAVLGADRPVRHRLRWPAGADVVAQWRQPTAGRTGSRAVSRAPGAGRRAADPGPRRRRDRVHVGATPCGRRRAASACC